MLTLVFTKPVCIALIMKLETVDKIHIDQSSGGTLGVETVIKLKLV